ncbi:hypothetical protein M3Y94_00455200 [Aphelenchoides besseyi]|nr:hypothetical protein M3Y94_00455200 [Aphelenchoides besseyi]KAI6229267.1 hypothetical protein M3Y95_00513100 [Aphelenchoides besseyi]
MPFLQLNFSTYDSELLFQQNVNQCLSRLHLPTFLINALFDLRKPNCNSTKAWKQLLYGLHVAFVLLLLIVVIGILLLEPYSIIRYDPLRSSIYVVLAAYFIKLQGFLSVLFLMAWNFRARTSIFQSLLMETSGASVLRKTRNLRSVNYVTISYNVFRVLLIVGISILRKLHADNEFEKYDSNEVLSWSITGAIVFNGLLCGLSHLAATSQVFIHTCIVGNEFTILAEDLRSDSNSCQLPVIKHYVSAYKNNLRLYKSIHWYVGLWVNLQLCFSFVQLFYIVSIIDIFMSWPELAINLILLLDSMITSLMHGLLIAKLHRSFDALPKSILNLAVSGKLLDEGTYSLINTFIAYVQQKHCRLYFVVGYFKVSVRLLIRIYVLVVVIVFWARFQSDSVLIRLEEIN